MRLGRSGLEKKDRSEIRKLLGRIYPIGGVLAAVCFLVTLIRGFELRTLAGFAVGYGYMCLCCFYLGSTCERAVSMDKGRAKRAMLVCYFLRYGGLFVLCAASMLTGAVNVVGVLVPQFFPRIALTIIQFLDRKDKI